MNNPWVQGFPRSEEQAVARCGTSPIPPDFVAWLWRRDSKRIVISGIEAGRAGADFYGKPIARWTSYALYEYRSASRFAYEAHLRFSKDA